MNNLLNSSQDLTRSRGIHLIRTEESARSILTELIASLLFEGPLFVIAGSDWLPVFELTCIIDSNMPNVKQILNRLYTEQTWTCRQLFDSLANRRSNGEAILVLDFLHSFYDAEIPLSIRLFRLSQCCRELQRLAFYRPVTVITTDTDVENREDFVSVLNSVADKTFYLEPEIEAIQQIALI